jgi:transcriptional regulator with XRE-family HTH domain
MRGMRTEKGQTVLGIAERIKLSEATIARIERGSQPLSNLSAFDLLSELADSREDWEKIHSLAENVPMLLDEWNTRISLAIDGSFSMPEEAIRIYQSKRSKELPI